MGKYYGKIGFTTTSETDTSVWISEISEERYYRGDIIKNYSKTESDASINDSVTINNRISIISDDFAYKNMSRMAYAEWRGIYWKIKSIEFNHPRLILTLGGLYDKETET